MPLDVTILADSSGGDLILYGIAVVGFLIVSFVINRVQKWWAELNKPTMGRSGSPPPIAPPRPRPAGERGRPVAPSLPRPVIRESLPEGRPAVRPPTVRGPTPAAAARTTRPPRPPVPNRKPRPAPPVEVRDNREAPVAVRPAPVAPAPAPAAGAPDDKERFAQLPSGATRRSSPAAAEPILMVPGLSAARLTRVELRRAFVMSEVLSPPLALRAQ